MNDDKYGHFGRKVANYMIGNRGFILTEDGEEIMYLAHRCGLMERVPYNPEEHGEIDDAAPGDMIWNWLQYP